MKFILNILAFATFVSIAAEAQTASAIEIYSGNNERFYMHINDLQQNNVAGARVVVKNLNPGNYRVKVIFENPALGSSVEDIYLPESTSVVYNLDYNTANIRTSKYNNSYRMVFVSSKNILPGESLKVSDDAIIEQGKVYINHIYKPKQGEMNIVIGDSPDKQDIELILNDPKTDQTTIVETSTSNGGKAGCNNPANIYEFNDIISIVTNEPFEEEKLYTAKNIVNSNCLDSNQLITILQLFGTDAAKFDLAIYAINFLYDKNNSALISNVFTDSATIQSFNELINK